LKQALFSPGSYNEEGDMSPNQKDLNEYVEERYNHAIDYYWKASRHNKRSYKLTRSLILILGSLVTLIASLSSAAFVTSSLLWDKVFAIGTPVIAAILTIVGGFSQTFQWGAAWQDMVITAQRLEKERDRFLVTKAEERDLAKEVDILSTFVLEETQSFFQRIIGGAKKGKNHSEKAEGTGA
jgi:hypothetical protein